MKRCLADDPAACARKLRQARKLGQVSCDTCDFSDLANVLDPTKGVHTARCCVSFLRLIELRITIRVGLGYAFPEDPLLLVIDQSKPLLYCAETTVSTIFPTGCITQIAWRGARSPVLFVITHLGALRVGASLCR